MAENGLQIRAVLGIVLTIAVGCSFANGPTRNVVLTSSVPARTAVGGSYHGETGAEPLIVELARGSNHFISATAPDHRPSTVSLNRRISGLGLLDFAAGVLVLVPFITFVTATHGLWSPIVFTSNSNPSSRTDTHIRGGDSCGDWRNSFRVPEVSCRRREAVA